MTWDKAESSTSQEVCGKARVVSCGVAVGYDSGFNLTDGRIRFCSWYFQMFFVQSCVEGCAFVIALFGSWIGLPNPERRTVQ